MSKNLYFMRSPKTKSATSKHHINLFKWYSQTTDTIVNCFFFWTVVLSNPNPSYIQWIEYFKRMSCQMFFTDYNRRKLLLLISSHWCQSKLSNEHCLLEKIVRTHRPITKHFRRRRQTIINTKIKVKILNTQL